MQQMQPGMIRYSNVPGFPSHAGLQQQMPPISMQNSTFNSQNFRTGQVHPGYQGNQGPRNVPVSIIHHISFLLPTTEELIELKPFLAI